MANSKLVIIARDINGKHITYQFDSRAECYSFATSNMNDIENDEILVVIMAGICIYSALGNKPITWDDIVGFFA